MAFLLPFEGAALGAAALEGLSGIVAGIVYAIESHKPGRHSDTPHAPDDNDKPDPDDPAADDPGGVCDDGSDTIVEHAQLMEINYGNEVHPGNVWWKFQKRRFWRKIRDMYYHAPDYAVSYIGAYYTAKFGYKKGRMMYRKAIAILERGTGQIVTPVTPDVYREKRAREAGRRAVLTRSMSKRQLRFSP